jgi:hypothetical protein
VEKVNKMLSVYKMQLMSKKIHGKEVRGTAETYFSGSAEASSKNFYANKKR